MLMKWGGSFLGQILAFVEYRANISMSLLMLLLLLLLLSSFTVTSTEGLTATCAAAFELS